jgi:hypothetical protein
MAARNPRELSEEAERYLRETDWLVIRAIEVGEDKPIPEDVRQKRAAARQVLNEIRR